MREILQCLRPGLDSRLGFALAILGELTQIELILDDVKLPLVAKGSAVIEQYVFFNYYLSQKATLKRHNNFILNFCMIK